MTTHDANHEERLFELCGAADEARAAFERSELARCAACRTLFVELLDLELGLGRAAVAQRELECEARARPPAPGEVAALREIERRSRASASRATWWRAAAALLVCVGVAAWLAWPRGALPSPPLGANDVVIELTHPLGPVGELAPFTWRAELPRNGWYVVRVTGVAGEDAAFEARSPHLTEPRWHPDAAATRTWPRSVRWEVLVHDASGARVGAAGADAVRSGS